MHYRFLNRLVEYSVILDIILRLHEMSFIKLGRHLNVAYCNRPLKFGPFQRSLILIIILCSYLTSKKEVSKIISVHFNTLEKVIYLLQFTKYFNIRN
jgi:hypothetical protein